MKTIARIVSCGLGLVLLLTISFQAHVVDAGRLWCKADPVVSLDDRLVSISLAIPIEYLLLVNGPTTIEIKTPKTVDRQLILNDLGFMGHGTVVTFVDGGGVVDGTQIPVHLTVRVPVDASRLSAGESVPIELTVLTDGLHLASGMGTAERTTMDLVIVGR